MDDICLDYISIIFCIKLFLASWLIFKLLYCRCPLVTVRNRSLGKVMFSQACVKNSVHGGVSHACSAPPPPTGTHAPLAHTPPRDACARCRYYEMRSISGQYASYWNAFFFSKTLPFVFVLISCSDNKKAFQMDAYRPLFVVS